MMLLDHKVTSAICCYVQLYLHSGAGRHPELLRQLPVPSQHLNQSTVRKQKRADHITSHMYVYIYMYNSRGVVGLQ